MGVRLFDLSEKTDKEIGELEAKLTLRDSQLAALQAELNATKQKSEALEGRLAEQPAVVPWDKKEGPGQAVFAAMHDLMRKIRRDMEMIPSYVDPSCLVTSSMSWSDLIHHAPNDEVLLRWVSLMVPVHPVARPHIFPLALVCVLRLYTQRSGTYVHITQRPESDVYRACAAGFASLITSVFFFNMKSAHGAVAENADDELLD
jgi:hypothetical protein